MNLKLPRGGSDLLRRGVAIWRRVKYFRTLPDFSAALAVGGQGDAVGLGGLLQCSESLGVLL